MARAELSIVLQDEEGDVQAGRALAFYEMDAVTPLAQTVYDAPSGGSPVPLPQTNSLGTFQGYVDRGQRVKLTVAGETGTRDGTFFIDPANILTQYPGVMVNFDAGLTVTRNSAGAATAPALTLRDTDAAGYALRARDSGDTANLLLLSATQLATAVPASFAAPGVTQATLQVQNTNATGTALVVRDSTNAVIGAWNEQSLTLLGAAKLGIGASLSSADPHSLQVIKTSPPTGWIAITAVQDVTGTGNDEGVSRFVGRHMTTGNSAIRAVEAQVIKSVGTNGYILWGHEVGVHQTVANGYGVGVYIYGNNQQWISGAAPSMTGEAGVYVTGPNGWDYGFKYMSPSGQRLFQVAGGRVAGDQPGDLAVLGSLYTTGFGTDRVGILNHTDAPAATTWTGLNYSPTEGAWRLGTFSNGGGGALPGLLNPSGGRLGVGVATTATISTSTRLHVAGAIAAAAGSVGVPSYHVVGDTDTGLNGDGSNGLTVVTAGAARLTFDANGNIAVGTGALAASAANGFLHIPVMTTTPPSGTPTAFTGRAPLVYDAVLKKLWIYDGGWRGVVVT